MSIPDPTPDTPLIRHIVTIVGRTCDPHAARWPELLARALGEFLDADPAPHTVLQAEYLQIRDARLKAVEAALKQSPRGSTGDLGRNNLPLSHS